MSHLQYHAYEQTGALKAARFGYTQSVRVENTVYVSGQGGWSMEDPDVWAKDQCEQVDWAFANIEKALGEAGAKFAHVFKVVSYHKPLKPDSLERMVDNFKKYMPNHKPLWTCVQVEMLGEKEMEIEIEVIAHIPSV